MKVIIKHYARGQELAIGSVTKEIWDYIQDKYEGNVDHYVEDICLDHYGDDNRDYINKVPEEFKFADNLCDNDDLFHKTAGWFDKGCIEISDNDGKIIYECNCSELGAAAREGIQLDLIHETIDQSVRYISIFSSPKGIILTGQFDIEGEFDPTKLKVLCTIVWYKYNVKRESALVTGFEYNGERIDCSIESARDEMVHIDIIDTKT